MFKTILARFISLLRMVKIEHSIFALPFAYMGFFWGAGFHFNWVNFIYLNIAMVAIRSYAMGFNRLIDLPFDRINPRTANRELVTGVISKKSTVIFLLICLVVFVGMCALLPAPCLILSPIPIILASLYSYTKRFTSLCHFVLGAVLGMSPIAGYIVATSLISPQTVVLGIGVVFWVAGFDLLYSCQDMNFDKAHKLHSFPAKHDIASTLLVSTFCHINTLIFFLLAGWLQGAGWRFFVVTGVTGLLMVLEHCLIKADNLRRLNFSFFTINGIIAIIMLGGVFWDLIGRGV